MHIQSILCKSAMKWVDPRTKDSTNDKLGYDENILTTGKLNYNILGRQDFTASGKFVVKFLKLSKMYGV